MLNFANSMQNACGLKVTAEQFLSNEGVSNLAFACAAGQHGKPELAVEFEMAGSCTKGINAASFEAATREFLLAIWRDGVEADIAMADIVRRHPEMAKAVGKAADAIESRHGLQWGGRGDIHPIAAIASLLKDVAE